jgi:Ca2+-transporting ATPase
MNRPIPLSRLADLLTTERGLTVDEVTARQQLYGFNDIVEAAKGGWRDLARDTARDPMIWFLVATSGLFAIIGDYGAATTLIAAMVPLIAMDAYLHRRTQASTEGLSGRLATLAKEAGVKVD